MTQDQLSLLDEPASLSLLPSAKVRPEDLRGVHGWTKFYAAFSEKFVISALTSFGSTSNKVLLDPFVGSGTTLVAALKMGVSAIGVDLDPFSCVLARAKIATKASGEEVKVLLRRTNRKTPTRQFSAQAQGLFSSDSLTFASVVLDRICEAVGATNTLDKILKDKKGVFDSEAVALAVLCIASAESAKLIQGSNPTWYREAVPGERIKFEELYSSSHLIADRIISDVSGYGLSGAHRDILVINKDIRKLNMEIKDKSVGLVITSPPYLTRLDYIVKHLPNLLILTGLIDVDFDELRKDMLGTPKIVDKGEFDAEWGRECVKTLEKISSHESYASGSYYIWTYFQYFSALFESIRVLNSKLSRNCKGIFVVQDSFYKDVEIELHKILIEMMGKFGLNAASIREDEARRIMRRLNPARQKIKKEKVSSEHAIYFSR